MTFKSLAFRKGRELARSNVSQKIVSGSIAVRNMPEAYPQDKIASMFSAKNTLCKPPC
jgi:hypothetical protein